MTGARREKGQRGFELDAHLTFARPLTRAEAERAVAGWALRTTLYGEEEVRGARVTGPADVQKVHQQLRAGLEGGVLRSAEVGLRGFLRAPTGSTDWVPWRRNVILPRDRWADVQLEEGVKYVLE